MEEGDRVRQSNALGARSGARLRLRPADPSKIEDTARRQEVREKTRGYRIALASLVLSIVVAVLTPGSAYLIARMSVTSSEHQSNQAFLREQQKSAYSDFYSAVIQVVQNATTVPQIFVISRPIEDSKKNVMSDFNSRMTSLADQLTAISPKYALVYISGSPRTVKAATALDDYLIKDVFQAATDLQVLLAVPIYSSEWFTAMMKFSKALNPTDELIGEFLDSVREDFGSAPVKVK